MRKKYIKYLLIGIVIINICYIFINQQLTMRRIQSTIQDRNMESQKVKSQNAKLQNEIKISQSDKYSEKLAREKLGLIKEGEIPVVNASNNK
ncbi:septum formation initiator family protein [Clostridium pasteurianum]|uniref:FtsB family cell division protein n=1 Tax=Clostridium pasteurianum TaxID=1501 RepID=UPI0022608B0B|nr:septum formation initiator family protein [Clostridium pasteurianum]UZW14037.1 septum formation initiator family protein [Clostridium pasteurianum]